ncbi:MAG TPA: hypothetical protein VFL59_15870 [Candidatus Nanopelagicales bacterium]|nr:hypothetical protein [Candidatus Nanopelagicales bacterium]
MADNVIASVRVDCARCGSVELPVHDVRLVGAVSTEPARAEFVCPRCATPGSVVLDERAVRLLLAADVTLLGPGVTTDADRQTT